MEIKINIVVLKFIAICFMVIDHLGAYIFTNQIWMRAIGRLAFPIFAFSIANGMHYTRNEFKYLLRMLMFAIIVQTIFIYFNIKYMNVLFTMALGIAGIIGYQKKLYLIPIITVLIAWKIQCDYSYYGIILIYIFYLINENKLLRNLLILINTSIFIFGFYFHFDIQMMQRLLNNYQYNLVTIILSLLQFVSLLALPIIDLYDNKPIHFKSKAGQLISQYFFYVFYPLHIVVILLLKG